MLKTRFMRITMMKKSMFLMSLFAIITVGTRLKAQEVMSTIDIRSQSCFITDGNWKFMA